MDTRLEPSVLSGYKVGAQKNFFASRKMGLQKDPKITLSGGIFILPENFLAALPPAAHPGRNKFFEMAGKHLFKRAEK